MRFDDDSATEKERPTSKYGEKASSRYGQDSGALEMAVNRACDQHSYFETKEKEDSRRFSNENICLIARWSHIRQTPFGDNALDDSSAASHADRYEDLATAVGFAHPEKAGGPATQQDLQGVSLSLAWADAFARALKSYEHKDIEKGGPERESLYCRGIELPHELMESLSKLSHEKWALIADSGIQPYFKRDSSENDTLASSSDEISLTQRVMTSISSLWKDSRFSIFGSSR